MRDRILRLCRSAATLQTTFFPFLLPRIPILLVTFVYLALLLLAPPQVTDIVRSAWTDEGWAVWFAFFLPPAIAGTGHLAMLGAIATLSRTVDSVIASLPLALLTIMTGLWATGALILAAPLALAGFALYYRLTLPIGRKPTLWAGAAAAVTVATFVACVVAACLLPVAFPTGIGALGVLTLGVSTIGLLVAVAALRPWLAVAYLLICLVLSSLFGGGAEVELFDKSVYERSPNYSLPEGLYAWLRSRADMEDYRNARRPYPVIIASAEGGGIYAAAHSYLALSAMQAVCPSFAKHLFATVGVSGGGLGNLLYSIKLDRGAARGRLQPCRPRTRDIDTAPLTTDLLSPALANLLFLQTADFLIPGPPLFRDGGRTLGEAMAAMAPGNSGFADPLRASWRPTGARPVTIFVATDVHSGNRFVITPIGDSGAENAETFPSGDIVSPNDISSGAAAVISARFPWLTSTARLKVAENSYRILADGGYFENSGADTVMDLVHQIKKLGDQTQSCEAGQEYPIGEVDACRCPIVIETTFNKDVQWSDCGIHIFIAYMPITEFSEYLPGYVYEDSPDPGQSYLFDPVSTMLRARQARGILALDRARSYFGRTDDPNFVQGTGVDYGYFPHQLPIEDLSLPLGWKLSRQGGRDILALAAPTGDCVGEEHGGRSDPAATDALPDGKEGGRSGLSADPLRIRAIKHDNGCNMKMLAWLFNPSGRPDAHAIKGW